MEPVGTVVIAVSGGIGSGKSTVCRMLEDLGAEIFDSDAVAREILAGDDEVRRLVTDAFGPNSFGANGAPNRTWLASVVFADERNRLHMNGIVHPRVASAFLRARADAESSGVKLLVHESALITEVRERDQFDAIVIVRSPLAQRIARVTARDRTSSAAVEARVRLQPTDQEFDDVADYVIDNDGTLAELRKKVRDVFDDVMAG